MKSETFNLVSNINNHLNENYYHSDDSGFKEGDLIVKNYSLNKDIVKAYNTALGIKYIQSAVYLTENPEEYKDEYNYTYEIEPIELKGPFNLEYSALICQDIVNRLDDDSARNGIVRNFVKAYMGNDTSKKLLHDYINDIPISDAKEYICKFAKVIKEV